MAPLPKIAVGGAPPPRLPGVVFPKKKNLHFCKDQSNHQKNENCTALTSPWLSGYQAKDNDKQQGEWGRAMYGQCSKQFKWNS